MATERRAIFANFGTVNVWSGTHDVTWETRTYKPGILLSDEIASGQSLQATAAPGLSLSITDVPALRSDVQSGDEFEIHVCRKTRAGWEKIGGFWGLVDEVTGPVNDITIRTLPPLERFTKVTRPRWSREDYLSRYPDDDFFANLESVQTEGRKVNLWQ